MAEPFGFSPDQPLATPAEPVPDMDVLRALGGKLGQTWPAHLIKAALGAAALPGDVYSGATPIVGDDGRTNPEVINRSADLAGSVMMGGVPAAGMLSKPGEFSLGIVPVDAARAFRGVPSKLPQDDLFQSAVRNTPGARIEEGSLTLPVVRNQHPDQAMEESLRGGVFYLPQGSKDAKYYTGTKENFAYGGSDKISGETAFKNPLVVKGATGGKAPTAAYDQLNGKGSFDAMRTDALRSSGGYYLSGGDKAELVRQFLDKYAPEMSGLEDHILQNTKKGNQLPYALQEAAVASAARKAGHDGVIGYSVRRTDKQPFISEIYDVRENRYPNNSGGYSTWGPEAFGVKE